MRNLTLGGTGITVPQNAFGALPIQRRSTDDAVALLIVYIPEAFVAVVVGEVVYSLAVLVVLVPVALIFFTIGEGVYSVALSLALDVFSLVGVAVFEGCLSLSVRFSSFEFAIVSSLVFWEQIIANNHFLSLCCCVGSGNHHSCKNIFMYSHSMLILSLSLDKSVFMDYKDNKNLAYRR